jgi:hypothetical protein
VKEDDMGRAFGMYERKDKCIGDFGQEICRKEPTCKT